MSDPLETALTAYDERNRCTDPEPDPPQREASATRTAGPGPALEFLTFRELRARVNARGPRRWLLRGLWPAGAYGAHAAEMKAQKSWNAIDMAVSVASGTAWLGHVAVDDPGGVVVFWGEGDDASLVRRVEAVSAARGLDPDSLPIDVCCRAPHLGDHDHQREMDHKITTMRPRLVILDPLYLSARGANGADLYAMGELLEHPQRVCVAHGAALLIVTHFNRKDGRGAARITGAGPAEWGRILILATVESRRTDPTTRETTVITELDVIGGEVPDQRLRLTRRISADDPDDLDSPLRYEVTVEPGELTSITQGDELKPAETKLLDALRTASAPRTPTQLVDAIAETHGHGLRRETVSRALNELARRGLADSLPGDGKGAAIAHLWFSTNGNDHAPV